MTIQYSEVGFRVHCEGQYRDGPCENIVVFYFMKNGQWRYTLGASQLAVFGRKDIAWCGKCGAPFSLKFPQDEAEEILNKWKNQKGIDIG